MTTSPIKIAEVVSSTLLGSPDFIAFIKDKFLSGKKPDKDLLALKELIGKVSPKDIFDEVESVFGKETALGRNIKMFLCQRYTGEKLKAALISGLGNPACPRHAGVLRIK